VEEKEVLQPTDGPLASKKPKPVVKQSRRHNAPLNTYYMQMAERFKEDTKNTRMMVEIERERLNGEKKTAELTHCYLEQQVESRRLKNDLIRMQIQKEKAEVQ
jgi:hypothetical protein